MARRNVSYVIVTTTGLCWYVVEISYAVECEKFHKNFKIISSPSTLKPYFLDIKISFTACGLTLLDLIAANIPSIGIPIESHQEELYLNCLNNDLILTISELEKIQDRKVIEIDDFFSILNRKKLRNSCKKFIRSSGIKALTNRIIQIIKR